MATRLIRLDIPQRTPTPNQWIHKHWRVYHKIRREWAELIWVAKVEAGVIGNPKHERVEIFIERHAARPLRDEDNLKGGLKPVLDSIVENGLILDDSMDVIRDLSILQMPTDRKNEKTVVKIRVICGG